MKSLVTVGCLVLLGALVCAPGCGSDSSTGNAATSGGQGGSGSGDKHGVGEHDEAKISAAKGGKVSGTGISIDIPGGALSKDTTVTIDIKDKSGYADADTIAVDVYELGPNGTKFDKPVPLTLDLGGAKAPKDKPTAVIAYYDGKAWQPLADSKSSGGKVTATTTHFTPFTIVWTNGVQTGGGCGSLEFTPCGGDVTGTWDFTAGCYDVGPKGADPTNGKCPQTTTTATVDLTGSITFKSDDSYSLMSTLTADLTFDLPAACLSAIGGSCGNAGAMDDGNGGCTVSQHEDPMTNSESGTYTTSGNTLTTTKTGEAAGDPVDYCVSGDMLKVKTTNSNGSSTIYVATKH